MTAQSVDHKCCFGEGLQIGTRWVQCGCTHVGTCVVANDDCETRMKPTRSVLLLFFFRRNDVCARECELFTCKQKTKYIQLGKQFVKTKYIASVKTEGNAKQWCTNHALIMSLYLNRQKKISLKQIIFIFQTTLICLHIISYFSQIILIFWQIIVFLCFFERFV